MSLIERNQELLFENVFSCRISATRGEINRELESIKRFLRENGIRRSGPVLTTTSALSIVRGRPILDFEILFPIVGAMTATGCYEVKPVFHLVNALRLRHEGGRESLPLAYNELFVYMINTGLEAITPIYDVAPEPAGLLSEGVGGLEVYVGVDPSTV